MTNLMEKIYFYLSGLSGSTQSKSDLLASKMNSSYSQEYSTIICEVKPFTEKYLLQIASAISYGIGVIGTGVWIRGSYQEIIKPDKLWTVFNIFKIWIKSLVSI